MYFSIRSLPRFAVHIFCSERNSRVMFDTNVFSGQYRQTIIMNTVCNTLYTSRVFKENSRTNLKAFIRIKKYYICSRDLIALYNVVNNTFMFIIRIFYILFKFNYF